MTSYRCDYDRIRVVRSIRLDYIELRLDKQQTCAVDFRLFIVIYSTFGSIPSRERLPVLHHPVDDARPMLKKPFGAWVNVGGVRLRPDERAWAISPPENQHSITPSSASWLKHGHKDS